MVHFGYGGDDMDISSIIVMLLCVVGLVCGVVFEHKN